jgi:putative transposase
MLTMFIHALMGAEADAVCGAEYGQRSSERVNQRNGYRERHFDTSPTTPSTEQLQGSQAQ